MAATKKILAFDLGAESGRGLIGAFDGERLQLEVVHRFPNGPVQTLDSMHWDVLRLHAEILTAMRHAAEKGSIDGIGVHTWAVDFALFRPGRTLLCNSRHYTHPPPTRVSASAF